MNALRSISKGLHNVETIAPPRVTAFDEINGWANNASTRPQAAIQARRPRRAKADQERRRVLDPGRSKPVVRGYACDASFMASIDACQKGRNSSRTSAPRRSNSEITASKVRVSPRRNSVSVASPICASGKCGAAFFAASKVRRLASANCSATVFFVISLSPLRLSSATLIVAEGAAGARSRAPVRNLARRT